MGLKMIKFEAALFKYLSVLVAFLANSIESERELYFFVLRRQQTKHQYL